MQFKQGLGWKACYDEEKGIYTARVSWRGDAAYYEIDAGVFNRLGTPEMGNDYPDDLIRTGRLLYQKGDGSSGPATETVYDDRFAEMCSWAEIRRCDNTSSKEMTDLFADLWGNEKTREYRKEQKENEEAHHDDEP